ncbi:hypothetical protein cbdbA558 [Dehalococcoides mccartyi CBDB1]|uniref:Uncharacterized protein n=1 Tax=Dehalococcoides mccartyi (strain CBDB1) TaxID=255470 RepID=A0A916KM24_DEHMC|nr:hypothetical protein cbdbA558 [Dehalococcoides mccartyi CBDB1]
MALPFLLKHIISFSESLEFIPIPLEKPKRQI